MNLLTGQRRIALILLLIGLAVSLRLLFSWTSLELLPATSDEASSVLWAKRIAEGMRPLLFIAQPYQFPIESYLMAPLVEWMPRNVFGARYQALLLGWLATGLLVLSVFKATSTPLRWAALLLVLFPSAYWIQHQAGYTPPQYAASSLLVILTYLAVVLAHLNLNNWHWFVLAGFSGGLAVSNHLTGLSTLIPAFIVLLFTASAHHRLTRYALLLAGVGIGIAPFLLARYTLPGAYDAVDGTVDWAHFQHQLLDFALVKTVPGVLGIKPTLFPDIETYTQWGSDLRKPFSLVYFGVLFTVTGHRLTEVWQQIRSQAKLTSDWVDVFILSSFTTIVMFSLSTKAGPDQYRFLLPLVACLPFIVLRFLLIIQNTRWLYRPAIAGVVLYAIFNIATTIDMIKLWRSDDTNPAELSHTYDLGPIWQYIKDNNISHCYATFWIVYRINMLSDEKITCAQPFNERFPGWPLPYKKDVDAEANTPVFAMMSARSKLTAYRFLRHINTSQIDAKMSYLGRYHLFDDFTHLRFSGNQRIEVPTEQIKITSATKPQQAIAALSDKNPKTIWHSEENQSDNTRLIVSFTQPTEIHEIKLSYSNRHHRIPREVEIIDISNPTTPRVLTRSKHFWEGIEFFKQKPIYHGTNHPVWLDKPQTLSKLEIRISKPSADRPWQLADILFASGG